VVNSAFHPSGVDKSSTSFGWGKGGNVTSVGWQVTLCDPMWHVSSRSNVATLRTAIHLLLTYLLTLLSHPYFLLRPSHKNAGDTALQSRPGLFGTLCRTACAVVPPSSHDIRPCRRTCVKQVRFKRGFTSLSCCKRTTGATCCVHTVARKGA